MSCRKRINSDANLNTDTIMEYTHKKKKQNTQPNTPTDQTSNTTSQKKNI